MAGRLVCSAVAVSMAMAMLSPAGAAPQRECVSLITVGPVDSALANGVREFVTDQYRVNVVVKPAVKVAPESRDEVQPMLAGLVGEADACLLALTEAPSVEYQGIVFKEERCGVVNVAALRSAGEVVPDDDRLARRVESESLRAIALMVGVPPCPFPRCALTQHQSRQDLDLKSRNPCPPCLGKVHAKLAELDILLPEKKPSAPRNVRPEDK